MFANRTTAVQYAGAVSANKVILGLPFFGYDWPTSNGTLAAEPEGAPSVVSYGQEMASGHPVYWDADTETAWTSYQVGAQWHEAYFENPTSLYDAAQLAQANGLGGVGIWALGMDGSSDQSMVSALDGFTPAHKDLLPGPTETSASPIPSSVPAGSGRTTTTLPSVVALPPASSASPAVTYRPDRTTTTTTTSPPSYQGVWQSNEVDLIPTPRPKGAAVLIGTLSGFTTNIRHFACLGQESTLSVYSFADDPANDYVILHRPTDCVGGVFVFMAPSAPPAVTTTTSTTTTTTSPVEDPPA
jgi:hypothetical protein